MKVSVCFKLNACWSVITLCETPSIPQNWVSASLCNFPKAIIQQTRYLHAGVGQVCRWLTGLALCSFLIEQIPKSEEILFKSVNTIHHVSSLPLLERNHSEQPYTYFPFRCVIVQELFEADWSLQNFHKSPHVTYTDSQRAALACHKGRRTGGSCTSQSSSSFGKF